MPNTPVRVAAARHQAIDPTIPLEPPADTRRRVVARIREETRVNEAGAHRMFDGLVRFLDLCGAMERGDVGGFAAVPSALVDLAWHAFILHTREYTEHCEALCGAYVHHEPTSPDATNADEDRTEEAYLRTRRAIEDRFGAIDSEIWPS